MKKIIKYLEKTIFHKQLYRFLFVGGIAFTVNEVLLFGIHGVLGLHLILAQVIAAEGAIFTSFCFHHGWTYKSYKERSLTHRYLHFNLTSLGGTLIANITLLICVHALKINYLLGFAVGAVFAIFWNYFANKHFIWKSEPETP